MFHFFQRLTNAGYMTYHPFGFRNLILLVLVTASNSRTFVRRPRGPLLLKSFEEARTCLDASSFHRNFRHVSQLYFKLAVLVFHRQGKSKRLRIPNLQLGPTESSVDNHLDKLEQLPPAAADVPNLKVKEKAKYLSFSFLLLNSTSDKPLTVQLHMMNIISFS